MIDGYQFGDITIAEETYQTDVIIYPDYKEVVDTAPELIIIGAEQPGLM